MNTFDPDVCFDAHKQCNDELLQYDALYRDKICVEKYSKCLQSAVMSLSKNIDSKNIGSKNIDSKKIDSKSIDSKNIDSKNIDSKDASSNKL
jgi:hypothetical protein